MHADVLYRSAFGVTHGRRFRSGFALPVEALGFTFAIGSLGTAIKTFCSHEKFVHVDVLALTRVQLLQCTTAS